jgi:lysozyme family protein
MLNPKTKKTMTRIEKYGIFCRSWEGGWSNHPNDKGGATMCGVTYATFCAYRKAKGLKTPTLLDLKNISDAEWNAILRWHTWDKLKCDEYRSEWVAYLIADAAWMSGAGYIKRIQSLFGLKADGIVGPVTLTKLNGLDQEAVFNAIWKQRKQFYNGIGKGKNSVFLKGWLRRLECVRYGYLLCNGGKKLQ